jgi:ActR/RegA family two-component response regulator
MARDLILIADDEPHYLEWLGDFLDSKGCDVEFHATVNDAYAALNQKSYRAVIVDLNIPVTGDLKSVVKAKGTIFENYPGLFLADFARNKGYRTRQVIVYSVHIVAAIEEVCKRLYCTYLAKGRPASFKDEILEVLSFDPTKK